MSHIPVPELRGRPRPAVLRLAEVLVGVGDFPGFLWLLDQIGRGESAMDLYRHLPSILKSLEHPLAPIILTAIGFWLLWKYSKYSEPPPPLKELVHPSTLQPIRLHKRARPALKRLLWASCWSFGAAVAVSGYYRTPVRDFIFVQTLSLPVPVPPAPPQITPGHRPQSPPPLGADKQPKTNRPRVASAQVPGAQPLQPVGSNLVQQTTSQHPITPAQTEEQPRSGAQNVSAYQEVSSVMGKVGDLSGQWRTGVQFAENHFTIRTQDKAAGSTEENEEAQAAYQEEINSALSPLDDRWNHEIEPEVAGACSDAVRLMKMPGEHQLTPNDASEEQANCNGAIAAVRRVYRVPTLQDVVNHRVDPDRFKPLYTYLASLYKKLGDYRDNPILQR
jgi:hypothetical protein